MTVLPRDQIEARNRFRWPLLAFEAAQILVLTYQRQHRTLSQEDLDAVQESAAETAAAFEVFSAAGLVAGADDQRLLAQVRKHLADGVA